MLQEPHNSHDSHSVLLFPAVVMQDFCVSRGQNTRAHPFKQWQVCSVRHCICILYRSNCILYACRDDAFGTRQPIDEGVAEIKITWWHSLSVH